MPTTTQKLNRVKAVLGLPITQPMKSNYGHYIRPLQKYGVLDRQTGKVTTVEGRRPVRAHRDAKNRHWHSKNFHTGYDGQPHEGMPADPNLWRFCVVRP